jgi:hypothetical protein
LIEPSCAIWPQRAWTTHVASIKQRWYNPSPATAKGAEAAFEKLNLGIRLFPVPSTGCMEDAEDHPRTLMEFKKRFATAETCQAYLEQLRWPEGFECPGCHERRA